MTLTASEKRFRWYVLTAKRRPLSECRHSFWVLNPNKVAWGPSRKGVTISRPVEATLNPQNEIYPPLFGQTDWGFHKANNKIYLKDAAWTTFPLIQSQRPLFPYCGDVACDIVHSATGILTFRIDILLPSSRSFLCQWLLSQTSLNYAALRAWL
jgi:hypothetical protein